MYPDLVEEDDDIIDTDTGGGGAKKKQRGDDDMWTPDGMYMCLYVVHRAYDSYSVVILR